MINPDTKQESWRLNKFVALCLGVSRRKADELIEKGKIIVDGHPARLGQQISGGK
ncbi:S4 domain-containing protein [Candidatus Minimicrobia vallesae]|uniref:S4 domain-containing protein n=1 Tax=Candidatus Minimicrobia vallesae TaxID=2841264 RepID=UPI001E4A6D31|nr:S4 domain-containing protein [Candidatus Minimicrobia vallesae]